MTGDFPSRLERRRAMLSIISWRFDECRVARVTFHLNSLADAGDVPGEGADDVALETGWLANDEERATRNEPIVSC